MDKKREREGEKLDGANYYSKSKLTCHQLDLLHLQRCDTSVIIIAIIIGKH